MFFIKDRSKSEDIITTLINELGNKYGKSIDENKDAIIRYFNMVTGGAGYWELLQFMNEVAEDMQNQNDLSDAENKAPEGSDPLLCAGKGL